MHRIDSPSRASSLPSRWKSTGSIVAGGILAFIVWTLPNWNAFWGVVAQFSTVWQIPTNRIAVLILFVKFTAPLFIMVMIGIVVWIAVLVKPSFDDRMAIAQEQRSLDVLSLPPKQEQPVQFDTFLASPIEVSKPTPQRYDPLTPIPPTLSTVEPLARSSVQSPDPDLSPAREDIHALPLVQQDDKGKHDPVSESNRSSLDAFPQENVVSKHPLISIQLLQDVRVFVNVPDGRQIQVPLTANARRLQLLAYIAWRQGEMVDRDKMLEQVFGWGFSDEEATEDKLTERFESHKKLLRKKVREVVVEQVNTPAGREVIDPNIDLFVSTSSLWSLSESCRVDDLAIITACSKTIATARNNGKLVDQVPEYIREACEQLIAKYTGDFLESLIKKFPGEFRAWQGRGSWVRKPFTLYRDYYLEALWLLGQYYAEKHATEEDQSKAAEWCVKAAQFYRTYAMHACSSKYDTKVTFAVQGGEYGERVGMSERAIRRCVVLLGSIGKADLVHQVWSAYSTHMKMISDQRWQPDKETLNDVQVAEAQTGAYRVASHVVTPSNDGEEQ